MDAAQLGFNPEYSEAAPERAELDAMSGAAVLEFGATWCGYCLAARGDIKQALHTYNTLPHIKIYDGKGKRLGRTYKVKLWPTLIFLKDGEEVARLVRPTSSSDIAKALESIL